jgi:two-component system response regulator FlrC
MSSQPRILVVEDDSSLRGAICDTLDYGGCKSIPAIHGKQALELLAAHDVDLIISDVQMDVMDGPTLLRAVKAAHPEIPMVLVTAHGSVEQAVASMREGAADYLLKPFDAEVLLEMVMRLVPGSVAPGNGMVAADRKMKKLCELAARVAHSDATVLISGESGTGKEVMARYIHQHSRRGTAPFVAINCAAIPENMLESMLFGYEKGAYTGAYQSRAGKFEQACGGTLLLDEISEMDLGLQAKLLRVLQEKEVERLGGNKLIPLDTRVLATTNRNLREQVAAGKFREDLYYRLNVFPIHVPALRERPDDIVPLAELLLEAKSEGRPQALSSEAVEKLLSHKWPGNVRELENTMQRASILASTELITAADVYFEECLQDLALDEDDDSGMLGGDLKARENQLIVDALREVNGSRKDAAARLGISPRTLRYKLARLKEMGVSIPMAFG